MIYTNSRNTQSFTKKPAVFVFCFFVIFLRKISADQRLEHIITRATKIGTIGLKDLNCAFENSHTSLSSLIITLYTMSGAQDLLAQLLNRTIR